MKTKHTPGPWLVGDLSVSEIVGINREHICRIDGLPPDSSWLDGERRIANAHLIAAAPELLDALKNALNVLDGVACGHLGTVQMESRAIKIARQAIAKAEGEE